MHPHQPNDEKDDLKGRLVEEAMEGIEANELLQVRLGLEPSNIPSSCPREACRAAYFTE